jgi:hypothetical protein
MHSVESVRRNLPSPEHVVLDALFDAQVMAPLSGRVDDSSIVAEADLPAKARGAKDRGYHCTA